MQKTELRENRRRGDLFLPIEHYEMLRQDGFHALDCHWHREMEFFKVVRGEMQVQAGSSFFRAAPGSLLFFSSEELHAAAPMPGKDCDYRAIVFDPDMMCSPAGDSVRMNFLRPLLSGEVSVPRMFLPEETQAMMAFDRLYDLLEKREGTAYPLFIKAALLQLFGLLMEKSSRTPENHSRKNGTADQMKSVLSYIGENYRRPLSLAELSEQCGLCEGHFCRVFKQYTMKTPVQYINTVRMDAAAQLLRDTDRKVLDIALDTGFNSVSYFAGVFREYMGIPPTVYRRQARREKEGRNLAAGGAPRIDRAEEMLYTKNT